MSTMTSSLSQSQEYQSFRSTIPQKKIVVDDDNSKEWTLYDAGPKTIKCPLICFPPASGGADVYFRQILGLSAAGFRVIGVEYPVYWTMKELCEGFRKLCDHLQLNKVHIFGASLGGFLAQKFAEFTHRSPRVASIILCNSFYDTSIFQQTNSAATFWMMPALFLKKMVMGNFEKGVVDAEIADSVDFLVEKLDQLSQPELASRLTLNCMNCYIEPQKLRGVEVTIIDVFDDCALSHAVREEMYKCYPDAKRAHLKTGGNFPYLSRSAEVNVFIQIHLKQFDTTQYHAKEITAEEQENYNSRDANANISETRLCITMTGGGGCCCRRPNKISPAPGTETEYHLVEIRPKRHLRIRHINQVPRDEKFQTEMDTYLMYRRQGYPSSLVTSGPLTAPKRTVVSNKPGGPHSDILPNTMNTSETPTTASIVSPIPNGISGMQSKESTFSCSSPLYQNAVRSASSVMVTVDRKQPYQGDIHHPLAEETAKPVALEIPAVDNEPKSKEVQNKTTSTDCVLFFIHGVGGSSDIWKPQLEYFANEGYEIIAPDLIGHGFSATPNNARAYHFDEIMADMEEMFDKYCKRKNIVIGHSYGCSFAAVLGRKRSRRVTKLVMISGGGPTPLNPQPGIFSLPVCVLCCVRPCVECTFKKSAFASTRRPVISPEEAFAIPTYVLRHTMNGQIWPDGDELFHNWLMCPTLLIYGLKDQLVSLREEKDMEEAIYQSRLEVIEDASHMVMIEAPSEVNQFIKEFLHQSSQFVEEGSPTREQQAMSRMSQRSAKSAKSARGGPHSKVMR
ncbi:protein ABHD8-like [Haliotis asinina]|uniref:protein ABHD8-like n=1 Tax=Haliotis asinina TaxID=109174 RepID=UPI0035323FA7